VGEVKIWIFKKYPLVEKLMKVDTCKDVGSEGRVSMFFCLDRKQLPDPHFPTHYLGLSGPQPCAGFWG
jgi:hypothetical protein